MRHLAARSSLRRSTPCPDHPLDPSKSDQTPAGLLARGSSRDARPSQASHDLASGPVAASRGREAMCIALAAYSCRDSLGLRRQAVRTAFPIKSLSGHRRDHCRQSSYPGRGRAVPKATLGHSQASMFLQDASREFPKTNVLRDGRCGTCRNPDGGLSFPKPVPDCVFPEMPHRRGRNRTIAHPAPGRLWEP